MTARHMDFGDIRIEHQWHIAVQISVAAQQEGDIARPATAASSAVRDEKNVNGTRWIDQQRPPKDQVAMLQDGGSSWRNREDRRTTITMRDCSASQPTATPPTH